MANLCKRVVFMSKYRYLCFSSRFHLTESVQISIESYKLYKHKEDIARRNQILSSVYESSIESQT